MPAESTEPVPSREASAVPGPPRDQHRLLLAGVGFYNLRDLSAGVALWGRLAGRSWPDAVAVEDFSFSAVAALHWLRERPQLETAILVAAAQRGRIPGDVHSYQWQPRVYPPEEVQERMAEAVTGMVSLDILLTVCGHFQAFPPRVQVIEIEPRDLHFGEALSPPVEASVQSLQTLLPRQIEHFMRSGALP